MKGTNIFILTMLALGAVVGTVILVRRTRAEAAGTDNTGQPSGNNTGSNTGGTGTSWSNTGGVNVGGSKALQMNLVLRKGMGYISNNAEVKELQRMMKAVQPEADFKVDGKFGPKTEAKLYSLTGMYEISLAAAKIKWPFA